jgi:hypothetical protein
MLMLFALLGPLQAIVQRIENDPAGRVNPYGLST